MRVKGRSGGVEADGGDGELGGEGFRVAVDAGADGGGRRWIAQWCGQRRAQDSGGSSLRAECGLVPARPPCQTGPTAWKTKLARGGGSPSVALASPVLQPLSVRQAARSSGPAARWMAPSTPPPPSKEWLAALTMASTWKLSDVAAVEFECEHGVTLSVGWTLKLGMRCRIWSVYGIFIMGKVAGRRIS